MITLGIKTWKLLKHETSRGLAFYIILRLVYFADVYPRRMTLLPTRSTRSADGGSTPLPMPSLSCTPKLSAFSTGVLALEFDTNCKRGRGRPGHLDCESVRVTRNAMNSPKYIPYQMFLPTPLFRVPSQNIYITYIVYSTTILWSIIL